jgi:heat shock protein HtpX
MNLFFWPIFLLLLLLYLRLVSPVRLLRRMEARPADRVAQWANVRSRLQEVARRQRLPMPRLWVLPEFSPNALVLRSWGRRTHLALTEGLVRSLSEEELDCALSLCLTHGAQRGRCFQTWVAAVFFPLAAAMQRYPLAAQLVLAPVLTALLRGGVSASLFLKADRAAAKFHGQWNVAAVLQKLSVLGRKIPLRRWNLALDSLFLLSPLSLDDTPLWSFVAQPPVARRRSLLLERSACESASSLP